MKWLIGVGAGFAVLVTFACLKVSSRCSREEEKRDDQREDG